MRKPRPKVLVAGLVAVLAAIVCLTVATQVWLAGPLHPPRVRSAHPIVTLAKAGRIKRGMSYAQVKAIIGAPGAPVSRFLSGPLPPFTPRPAGHPEYEWRNSDGSFLRVTFAPDGVTGVRTMWLQ